MASKKINVGGQAVIEGVMMKGPEKYAVAIRKSNGNILLDKGEVHSITERFKFLKIFLIRGVVAFFESMTLGMKTLLFSANYFDNEEKGLFGSRAFKRKHKDIADRFLINFDCVGEGDAIFVGYSKKDENKKEIKLLRENIKPNNIKKPLFKKVTALYFSSDQMIFENSVAFAALKGKRILRTGRIHTPFDTKCDFRNIEYISASVTNFIKEYVNGR